MVYRHMSICWMPSCREKIVDTHSLDWNLDMFELAKLTDSSPLQFCANLLFNRYDFDELRINRNLRFAFMDVAEVGLMHMNVYDSRRLLLPKPSRIVPLAGWT